MIASMNGIRNSSLSRIDATSWYALKISLSSRPSDSTMYFSHAHLYLNGTSWLTSVWPLMMRLSAALTRRLLDASTRVACGALIGATAWMGATPPIVVSSSKEDGCTARAEGGRLCARFDVFDVEGLTSSSQTNIGGFPVRSNYPSVASKHQALLDIGRASLLCLCIDSTPMRRVKLDRTSTRQELHATHRAHLTDTLRMSGRRRRRT